MKITKKQIEFKCDYYKDLKVFLAFGVKYSSIKKFSKDLKAVMVTWICENENEDVHDYVDIVEMEKWNVEIIGIMV